MHVWRLKEWKKQIDINRNGLKKGLRLHFDQEVDPNVRQSILDFAKWIRCEYEFPLRVNVYVKSSYRIKAKDGDLVVGTCWQPAGHEQLPYIRLATGDYCDLVAERGKEQAIWAILCSFTHELTHYFQYINGISLTDIGEERQANFYAKNVLYDYYEQE